MVIAPLGCDRVHLSRVTAASVSFAKMGFAMGFIINLRTKPLFIMQMVLRKRYMDAQMSLFVFLIVVCTVVCAIETQVVKQKRRKENCAKIQDLDVLNARSLFVKIAGIQGMICIIND